MSTQNAVIIPWWREDGVVMTFVMEAISTNPRYLGKKQTRIAGGGGKKKETILETAIRELEEETGLVVEDESAAIFIHEIWVGSHHKTAFLVPLERCSGKLRVNVLHEQDADLGPPRPVPLTEAIHIVHQTRRNSFNHDALVRGHRILEEGSVGNEGR